MTSEKNVFNVQELILNDTKFSSETKIKTIEKKTSFDSVSTEDEKSYKSKSPEQTENKNENLFKVEFIWRDPEEKVKEAFLCGDFGSSSWEKRYSLVKHEKEKIFTIVLNLKEGEYQYKFLINNEWKILMNFPQKKNNKDTLNNLLRLKNDSYTKESIVISNNISDNYNNINIINKKEKNNEELSKTKKSKKDDYDCQSGREFFKSKPAKLPKLFSHGYEYKNENQFSSENEGYGNIKVDKLPHVFYNHLITNKTDNSNDNYTTFSLNHRARSKLLTMIIYNPKNF